MDSIRCVKRGQLCDDRVSWNFFINCEGNVFGEFRWEDLKIASGFQKCVSPDKYFRLITLLDRMMPKDKADHSKPLAVYRKESNIGRVYFIEQQDQFEQSSSEFEMWELFSSIIPTEF